MTAPTTANELWTDGWAAILVARDDDGAVATHVELSANNRMARAFQWQRSRNAR